MPDLRISDSLTLPDDAVTQTFGVLAKRGSGKTYTMLVLAEELLKVGQQVAILDPVGVCWGLRSSADGDAAGLPIVILGGDHADVPLEATVGTLVADLVIDERISVVLDLSLFSKNDQRRFVTDFAERLYHKNRAPLHLMLDEADEFAPQRPMPGHQRMLGAIEDLVRRGRARGIGVTLVTQRAAVLNKDVLTQIEVLIALKTTGPQDRAALDEWVKFHGDPEQRAELLKSLPSLAIGEAWVWSPGWLDVFTRIKVRRRETFDSSATPKPGQTVVAPRVLADVDLAALRDCMAASIERAKDEDPKALHAMVADLKRRLTAAEERTRDIEELHRVHEKLERQVLEVPAVSDETLATLTEATDALRSVAMRIIDAADDVKAALHRARPGEGHSMTAHRTVESDRPKRTPSREVSRPSRTAASATVSDSAIKISGPQQRILDALAEMEAVGLRDLDRSNVAVYADASPRSSAFGNNLGALRSAGYLDYPSSGRVCLTDAGRELATAAQRPRSLDELHELWCSQVSGPQARIIRELVLAYPVAIERNHLADLVDASPTSSAFGNNLGHLRGLHLIEYPSRGMVVATSLLFPDGLR